MRKFNVGDTVVFIGFDKTKHLKKDTQYIIKFIVADERVGDFFYFNDDLNYEPYYEGDFITLREYRKMKLKKING